MDAVSERLADLSRLPVFDAEQMASRVIFEYAGRHVMQEINRGLPETPPPEGFPIFCNRWTAFVQTNIDMEKAAKGRELPTGSEAQVAGMGRTIGGAVAAQDVRDLQR